MFTRPNNGFQDYISTIKVSDIRTKGPWADVRAAFGITSGAKGDGITDDAPAIRACIDAVYAAGGGTVYLPPGTYLIASLTTDVMASMSMLCPKDGVNIIGDGDCSILKIADGMNALTPNDNGSNVLFAAGLLSNCIFSNFVIDWNGANNLLTSTMARSNNVGIGALYGGHNILIDRVTIKETPGNQCIMFPIQTSYTANRNNITVQNCKFIDSGSGLANNYNYDHSSVYLHGEHNKIINNEFTSVLPVYGTAFELNGNYCEAYGNKIYNYLRMAYMTATAYFGIGDIDIHDNIAINVSDTVGIETYGATEYAYGSIKIRNNTFRMIEGAAGPISMSAPKAKCQELIITNNKFVMTPYDPIDWGSGITYATNAYCTTSNRVYLCTVGGTTGATAPTHTAGTATDGGATWEYKGTSTAWASSTVYATGAYMHVNNKVYVASVGGTSSATALQYWWLNHISGTKTDGTVTWQFIGSKNISLLQVNLTKELWFEDNYIEGFNRVAVSMGGTDLGDGYAAHTLAIRRNHFVNCVNSSTYSPAVVHLSTGTKKIKNLIINDNIFDTDNPIAGTYGVAVLSVIDCGKLYDNIVNPGYPLDVYSSSTSVGLRVRHTSAIAPGTVYAAYGSTWLNSTSSITYKKVDGTALGWVKESTAAAAPTTGTWAVNDIVFKTSPAAGGVYGWVCITAGTPGTWVAFGIVGAIQGASVAYAAGATPTKAEFDALVLSLRNGKLIAT